jgi:hypothetical protein
MSARRWGDVGGSRATLVALALWSAGCGRIRPTPAPSSGFDVVDTALPGADALRAYVGALRFDENYAVGDAQRLMIGHYPDAHYGPLVTIQPEVGNYRLTWDDLRRGRIVARIINADSIPYPKLGLAPHSVTYWWAQTGPLGAGGRSVFISTDSGSGRIVSRTVGSLVYEAHPGIRYAQAAARWFWDDADEKGWFPCPGGCCKN